MGTGVVKMEISAAWRPGLKVYAPDGGCKQAVSGEC